MFNIIYVCILEIVFPWKNREEGNGKTPLYTLLKTIAKQNIIMENMEAMTLPTTQNANDDDDVYIFSRLFH